MTKPVVCEEDGATVHRLHPVLEVRGRRGVQIEAAQQDPVIVGPSIPGVLFHGHAQAAEDTSFSGDTFEVVWLLPNPGEGSFAVFTQHCRMLGPIHLLLALAKALKFAKHNHRDSHLELA